MEKKIIQQVLSYITAHPGQDAIALKAAGVDRGILKKMAEMGLIAWKDFGWIRNHRSPIVITLRRQWIINKLAPCGCGCHGQDRWHKSSYRRTVHQTSDTEGWVKMPYSTKPVRVTRSAYDATHFGPWIVDRDSITWDK